MEPNQLTCRLISKRQKLLRGTENPYGCVKQAIWQSEHRWCVPELQVHQPAGEDSFSSLRYKFSLQPGVLHFNMATHKENAIVKAQQITLCTQTHLYWQCVFWCTSNQPAPYYFLCKPTHWQSGATDGDPHSRKALFYSDLYPEVAHPSVCAQIRPFAVDSMHVVFCGLVDVTADMGKLIV